MLTTLSANVFFFFVLAFMAGSLVFSYRIYPESWDETFKYRRLPLIVTILVSIYLQWFLPLLIAAIALSYLAMQQSSSTKSETVQKVLDRISEIYPNGARVEITDEQITQYLSKGHIFGAIIYVVIWPVIYFIASWLNG